eukprot:TRINITY_DN3643_c0_g1_i3.p1 TRINITY_DN3643_c0_g1~~TRINITY_DN3643_c0_g1_i3.p1  ORF type:complete len:381 (+),score=69.42 TRINITY_DN3643_c0_g1_i3:81-1223(+)
MKVGVIVILCLVVCANAYPTNVTEIIRDYGYPCEDYLAQTPDGWSLSIQRIPHGKSKVGASKGVVFLQHGLACDSTSWVLNPASEDLPLVLADAGYDVWMGNNRGNGLSMINKYYTPDQPQFWNFTWDDMASSDLPTMIDFVLTQTKEKTLAYIGVSEGTTIAFSGFLNPELAAKISIYVALAPVAYVHHENSLVMSYLADLDAAQIIAFLGDHEFYLPVAIHQLIPDICELDPTGCEYILSLLMGPSIHENSSRFEYYLNYQPVPTSVKNMIHWSQGVTAEVFQKYDYGREGNMVEYGQPTPPVYDLKKLPKTLNIALFTGGNDYLADPKDVATLLDDLPTSPVSRYYDPTYSHIDYVMSPNAATTAYPKITKKKRLVT